MNNQIYESHLQKSSSLKNEYNFVNMNLGGAEYMFDIKQGQWKMNILDKEYNKLLHQNQKDDDNLYNQKSEEQVMYDQKCQQLERIKQDIKHLKLDIIDLDEQFKLSKDCQQILVNCYIKEKLETDRIRKAREKLFKINQELNQ